MREPAHVYQNREDGYDLDRMHYCESCNGHYGVPHDFNHEIHFRQWWYRRGCACRLHREADGLSRQGDLGWVLEDQ